LTRFSAFIALFSLSLALTGCAGPHRRHFDIYARTGDWAQAEQTLRRALQTDPDDPELYFLLGQAHGRQGEFADMDMAFERSLSISARYGAEIDRYRDIFALERLNRGIELYDRGEYEAAVRELREIETIRKGETRHLPALGLCYIALGRTDEAERVLRIPAEVDGDETALAELVRLNALEGDSPEVIIFARRLLDRNPARREVLPALAAAYEAEGMDEEAAGAYREILEAEPENRSARYNLARILARLGRPAEALPHIEELARLEPDETRHRYTICALLYDDGRLPEALACFEAYAADHPGDRETIEYLYALNRALGRRDEARRLRDRLEEDVLPAPAPAGDGDGERDERTP
jgi:Flp pilus assembly protein TadD